MRKKRLLIVGEIFVDHHLDIRDDENCISRLGGIFHAIRACDALDICCAIAYYAPSYLEKDIKKYCNLLNVEKEYCLGTIDRAPNVMLIGNSDESGDQLYDNVLCKQAEFVAGIPFQTVLSDFDPSEIIIFPGRYDNKKVLNYLQGYEGKIHIDMNYDCDDILELQEVNVETIFLSTSTKNFRNFFEKEDYKQLVSWFKSKGVHQVLVKENRGGSWLYDYEQEEGYEAPAYLNKSVHSVGVGDVYDIAYIYGIHAGMSRNNMSFASWVAALYSKTLEYNIFKADVGVIIQNKDEFLNMDGIRVPWNVRKRYPIYMAAPDFDYVDTSKLKELTNALLYHNFLPRLPIKENGQVNESMNLTEELEVYHKDIELLEECKLMVATLLYNDQGTLVEIGYYQASGKTVILYDPYKKMDNMFLKHSCNYYCDNISDVINAVFLSISEMIKNEKEI